MRLEWTGPQVRDDVRIAPKQVAFFGLWVCLLAGCAAIHEEQSRDPPGEYVIAGMVIRNDLAYPVSDVMIEVPATGAFAGCGNIMPRTACSTTFESIDYRRNALKVSWKEYGQPQQTDEFILRVPDTARPGDAFVVEVSVFAPGQAGARLVESDPAALRIH